MYCFDLFLSVIRRDCRGLLSECSNVVMVVSILRFLHFDLFSCFLSSFFEFCDVCGVGSRPT